MHSSPTSHTPSAAGTKPLHYSLCCISACLTYKANPNNNNMSRTDFLGLNDHKLFKQLAKTIGTNHNKTLNIITERDNVLYAWNKEDNCVLTVNVRAARENEESSANYQTLLPHSPPYFCPERIIVNETNTILIAAGPNGVLVFELPDRTPPCGNFANNKEVIYCRTYNLLENVLSFSSSVECRQVRFHPGSPTDSQFLVLTSDNKLRLFSLSDSSVSDLATYALGPKPAGKFPDRNLSFLDALGDMAVDFDFSAPSLDTSKSSRYKRKAAGMGRSCEDVDVDEGDLLWPVFILYGNGLVCKMIVSCAGDRCHPGLYGPVPFKNFPTGNLADFCSIICMLTTPSIIVIAHCNGNLFHGLELPTEENNEEASTMSIHEDHKTSYCKPPTSQIYLLEVIEVELGLTTSGSNTESAIGYTCPIFLDRDRSKHGSYYATHNTGVHCVSIQAAVELNQYVNKEDDEAPSDSMFSNPSSAEYLICTRAGPNERLNPVLGIAAVNQPHSLITFLANGNVVTLELKDELRIVPTDGERTEEDNSVNLNLSSSMLSQSPPFDVYINNILKQITSQPILQVDTKDSEPSTEICFEVLERASKIFREEYFVNLTKAREEIEKRSQQLKVLQDFQILELNNMQNQRESLETNTKNIVTKYQEVTEKQEDISKRCQMMLVMLSRKQTEPSIAEEKYFEELKTSDKKIDGFITAIQKLKNKMQYQRNQMVNWKRENQRPEPLFPGQSEIIRQNLSDTTKKIADITTEVKEYMTKLNIR